MAPPDNAAARRILLIDDSQLVLDVTRAALEREGYAVATALTVAAFEEERAKSTPDLIIVDIQMPEAFGDDLAQTLRGAYGITTPIVFLSTLPEDELERRANEADAQGWVTKRAGLPALVAKVRELLPS